MRLKRSSVSLFVGLCVVASVVAVPVQAASSNPVSSFFSSVKTKFSSLYLRLPGNKPGRNVLALSNTAMQNLTTAKMNLDVKGELIDDKNTSVMNGVISVAGPIEVKDSYDPKTAKQDLNLKGEFTMQGTTLKADADFKVDGEIMYVKLNSMPAFPPFSFTSLQGEWLKLDPAKMSARAERTDTTLTKEQRDEVQKAALEMIEKSEVSEAKKDKLNGKSVFVVDVKIKDEALLAYMKRIMEIENRTEESQRQASLEQFSKALEAMNDLRATLWIDQGNFYMRKMVMPFEADIQKMMAQSEANSRVATRRSTATTPFGDPESLKTFKGSVEMSFDDFNKKIEFVAPETSRDFQEAFSELMMGTMGAGAGNSMMAPSAMPTSPRMNANARPAELKDLTPAERQELIKYGINPDEL